MVSYGVKNIQFDLAALIILVIIFGAKELILKRKLLHRLKICNYHNKKFP